MLPIITPEYTIDPLYQAYLLALEKTLFSGEIRLDYGTRVSLSTDNSIYQVIPQAVLFPKNSQDVVLALTLAAEEPFRDIRFSPRGGGTATNGQSLSSSILIDCSKYMRNILEINIEEGWVRVQPGVIEDQLNEFLKPYQYYFAPEISPSNRATLGGMINTDACGNGQKIIGRTSDHVVELIGVLSNGSLFSSLNPVEHIFSQVAELLEKNKNLIKETFPNTPRTLSGYNLLKASEPHFNLNYLLCGSEGTLAIITECRLKITPLPKYHALAVLQYRHFSDALQSIDITKHIKPIVIECIDERLLNLARSDSIYFYVKSFIENPIAQTGAINLVEFISNDEKELQQQLSYLRHEVDKHKDQSPHAMGYYITQNPEEIKQLWMLRKKGVGLISQNKVGTRRPIPFIEDTAVPPESLAAYIGELKQLLDAHQLQYGMYGHIDAGCVHVRPALDLQLLEDRQLHETLSKQVVDLIQKYHGVMWGEHGMGFRVQYNELFFGKELYMLIRRIKTLFDPCNKLNPGKVALPLSSEESLVCLSGPLRAQFDVQIPVKSQTSYASALACNGNGACFNYATKEVMCPSYKVTKDRIHSPKGRAVLLREWLRQIQLFGGSTSKPVSKWNILQKWWHKKSKKDFSHEAYRALQGCLNCKACAGQCPLHVDIPEMKSQFLMQYYQRYWRPFREYILANVEALIMLQGKLGFLLKLLFHNRIAKRLFRSIGLVDIPQINPAASALNILPLNMAELDSLSYEQKAKSVIIVQDVFTRFYHPELLTNAKALFNSLGYTVYFTSLFSNGKPFHTYGFLRRFKKIVKKNSLYLQKLAQTKIPMVGLDPSITLTYRDEYKKVATTDFEVLLPQEWLQTCLPALNVPNPQTYYLLTHCTEKSLLVAAEKQWVNVFKAFGLTLIPLATGCCGMAGGYGHELEHRELSKQLFDMDWSHYLENKSPVLATGYSCRAQAYRFKGNMLQHPIDILKSPFEKGGLRGICQNPTKP